jgi:CheY-like chemotaxis protein
MTPPTDGRGGETTAGWTVLVVDDQLAYRTVLAMLVDDHHRLTLMGIAPDGQTALELARQQCPDAIILDVHMPVMDGLTALPRLREACPDSVIAIYSSDPHAAHAALGHGADLVADKAEEPMRLIERIVELCDASGRGGP